MAAAVLLIPAPRSVADVASATCHNCDNASGAWGCSTHRPWGGTSCTVSDSQTCTVSGNCGKSGSVLPVRIPSSLILQIAASHPRVAATAFLFSSGSLTPAEGQVFWHNRAVSAGDVQQLINGQPLAIPPTPGDAVVYAVAVEPLPPAGSQPQAVLRIVPVVPSSLDPGFSDFVVTLRRGIDPANPAAYVPTGWQIQ